MTYRLEHRNIRLLVDDVVALAARDQIDLSPRPWNRFEPDDTDWWLVPASDWPAHKHAKLFLHWLDRSDERAEAALHFEKGLGPEVRAAYDAPRGKRRIMSPDWAWYGLLESFADAQFREVLAAVKSQAKSVPVLRVEGGYVPDPDAFDPYAYIFKLDRFVYRVRAGSDALDVVSSEAPAELLDPLKAVTSISELENTLVELTENPWLWMDLMIGLELKLHVPAEADPPPDPPIDLWSDLESFGPLFLANETSR
ncbi:MAG: hypothetical protein R3191_00145 [Anaerolineales bacterium]|nr:hypothetical protein [Anaerolineales bacterium]